MKGFTLIELLVVVAIIALLSSVGLAALSETHASSRDSRRLSDMHTLITAQELDRLNSGTYFCANSAPNLLPSEILSAHLISEGYLPNEVVDPINDVDQSLVYQYASYKKEPGGACGQSYAIHYFEETVWHVAGTDCSIAGTKGKWIWKNHCVLYGPEPPPCSDPYNITVPGDCQALQD